MTDRVPLAAALLGSAGLLPPLVGAVVAYGDLGSFGPVAGGFILTYAALILSFLGGSWWAFASREGQPRWWLLLFAVAPSLAAWAILPMRSTVEAGLWMAALIAVSPVGDAFIHRRGLAPAWWMRLRVPLSLILALLVGLTVWWGR
ncbi:MAG TPA: DUF3429 domain-containing protein [Sphingomicrobium sp.]|jgi:hypothetical protein|nr:DUF3429 domain-containing protein [Sphingomicrobium sp.]